MRSETRDIHYPAIDSLRAIAVLSVILYHLDKRLVPGGFVGVDTFFVISGFVVSLSMSRLEAPRFGAFSTHFYARRLIRIAPALIVCLLVTTLASSLFIPHAWLSDANWKTGAAAFFGLSNFVLAAPSNAYFSPRAEFNPFTHTWSLAVEEQFYLLFPIVFFAFVRPFAGRRIGRPVAAGSLALLSTLSLACCWWWTRHQPNFAFYLIPARFWELGAGVGLFMSWERWHPLIGRLRPGIARSLALAALALLLASMTLADETAFPFPWALGPVIGTTLLIALIVARPERVLPAPLLSSPVVWIGKISYSWYLWHWPIFVLARWTVGIESPLTRFAALALSLLLAAASYRWVETPVRTSRTTRTAPRWQVVLAGLSSIGMSAGVGWFVSSNEQKLTLSVTADASRWSPDGTVPAPTTVPEKCNLRYAWVSMKFGAAQTLEPEGCAPSQSKLLVAGDSHAWAYSALFRMYATQSGHEVKVLREVGCPVFGLMTPTSAQGPKCIGFLDSALLELNRSARSGDVLFLPSLRLTRLRDQWGGDEIKSIDRPDAREAAVSEAVASLEPVARRGVTVVFEAPKPLFRSPPFRCSDWFNKMNPICAGGFEMSRADFEQLRAPALAAMGEVVKKVPNAVIWDPAETLCTSTRCTAYADGQSLYFDGDHLSGLGNAALYADFSATMQRLMH